METKDILLQLRTQMGLSQDELAEKVFVTRQAVSRWETGETVPNTETLKLLSMLFDVSINELLGQPMRKICQCCGMPLQEDEISRNEDGTPNPSYCKWCYADGKFTYRDMDNLIDVCVPFMAQNGFAEQEARAHLKALLPTLDYWKNFRELADDGEYEALKRQLAAEINALGVAGLPEVKALYPLVGSYVNLAYPLPGGHTAQFLDDDVTYLGCQLQSAQSGLCYGVLANEDFLLVCTYEAEGANPELLLYKKR